MFIIFGSPRSGTTLLSSILDAHSQIIIPGESDFIVPMTFIMHRIKRDEKKGKKVLKEFIVSTDRYPYNIGEFLTKRQVIRAIDKAEYNPAKIVESIYGELAKVTNKKIAGDKSPNDLSVIRFLFRNGFFNSDIKVIHIIRDVRDVLLSVQKRGWVYASPQKFTFPKVWNNSNLFLSKTLGKDKKRYHFLKYEDLVSFPKESIKNLCSFLGVSMEEQMLDPNKRVNRFKATKHHQNINKPFLKDRVGAWKNNIKSEILEACEKQAGEAITFFNYQ